jgi:hypothetical protein
LNASFSEKVSGKTTAKEKNVQLMLALRRSSVQGRGGVSRAGPPSATRCAAASARTVVGVPVREKRDAAYGQDAQHERLESEQVQPEGDKRHVKVNEGVQQMHGQAVKRAVVGVVCVYRPLRHARMLLRRLFGVAHGARAAPHSARPGAEQWLDGGAG